jgi:hypothetical protein
VADRTGRWRIGAWPDEDDSETAADETTSTDLFVSLTTQSQLSIEFMGHEIGRPVEVMDANS